MSDADGLGDLDYARAAWWRDATLVHTGQVYTPGQTDVGGTLTLTLAYTDGFLTDETVTVATGAVADDPTPFAAPPATIPCAERRATTISGDGGADMLDGLDGADAVWRGGRRYHVRWRGATTCWLAMRATTSFGRKRQRCHSGRRGQ